MWISVGGRNLQQEMKFKYHPALASSGIHGHKDQLENVQNQKKNKD